MPSAQPGTALGADRAPPQSCFREGQRRSRRQSSRHVDVSNLAGQPALSQKCTTSLNTQLALLCQCVFCDCLVFHRRGQVECAAASASASAARPRLRADHRALGVPPRREVTDSKHTPPRLWAAHFSASTIHHLANVCAVAGCRAAHLMPLLGAPSIAAYVVLSGRAAGRTASICSGACVFIRGRVCTCGVGAAEVWWAQHP